MFEWHKYEELLFSVPICCSKMQKLELLPIIKFLRKQDFPASKASELGVGLGIKKARIEEILQNNPLSSDKVLMGVIQHWLDDDLTNPGPSWPTHYSCVATSKLLELSLESSPIHLVAIDIIPSLYNLHRTCPE